MCKKTSLLFCLLIITQCLFVVVIIILVLYITKKYICLFACFTFVVLFLLAFRKWGGSFSSSSSLFTINCPLVVGFLNDLILLLFFYFHVNVPYLVYLHHYIYYYVLNYYHYVFMLMLNLVYTAIAFRVFNF